jgi:hypothetical protein
MGIVRVHITVNLKPPIVKKQNFINLREVIGKTKSLHDGQVYRGLVLTRCGMVMELFVENFPDNRPLIPSAGLLLREISRDPFPQSHVSWKVRT